MKVIVVGEICIDKFIYCNTTRLSPEAPVPVLNPIKVIESAGMVGNTAANVKSLLPTANISYIIQDGDITKTRYIEEKSNHMFLRVDEGEDKIPKLEWSSILDIILDEADIVIVSDYNKGFLSNLDLKKISKIAKLSILDSKRKLTDDVIKDFTFVKLNESEHNNNAHLTAGNIITTLGKMGAKYNGMLYSSPKPQDTIDVSGAGDTFTAAFITKFYQTLEEGPAIEFANQKSSEVVSRRGVVTPSL